MKIAAHRFITPPLPDASHWISSAGAVLHSSSPPQLTPNRALGDRLRRAGVTKIILLHGTFVGDDVLGLSRVLSRYLPTAADSISAMSKQFFDSQLGSLANYDAGYAQHLSRFLGIDDDPIPVEVMHWSGENHHLGRLDAIVRLLDRHLDNDVRRETRTLVMAHSHGGNVMALWSHLAAASIEQRSALVARIKSQYTLPIIGRIDRPAWQRVFDYLLDADAVLPTFDIATFGTPPRYRWPDHRGYRLHLVNHHPLDPDRPARAVLPRNPGDLVEAVAGDYIQHLGIAGTDIMPNPLSPRDWFSDRRLGSWFEPDAPSPLNIVSLWRRLRVGSRLIDGGMNLLCDYPADELGAYRNIFGHAVYTHPMYIPFHMETIADEFYDAGAPV